MLKRALTVFLVVSVLFAGQPIARAATGTVAPFPKHQLLNNSGLPCVGCKLFTYSTGTTTKVNTYTDVGLLSANTNPIVLDSAGRATIFLTPGVSYKFVLAPSTDTDPPLAPIWTVDGVSAVPATAANVDIIGTAGEGILAGDAVYLSDGGGGRNAGTWYRTDADFAYASTEAPIIGIAIIAAATSGSTVTVRVAGLATVISGSPSGGFMGYASATAGEVTITPPTLARSIVFGTVTNAGIIARDGYPKFAYPPVGVPTYARETADVTKNNSTVFADLTGLSFTVPASTTWSFDATLFCISAAAADIKFTLTGPAAPTAVRYAVVASDGAASTAFGTLTSISTQAIEQVFRLTGTLRIGSTAGTVQVQMAQNVADVSNTICHTDSNVIAWRIN